MLEERISGLRETVISLDLYPEHADLIDRTLDLLRVAYTKLAERSTFFDRTGRLPHFSNELTEILNGLRDTVGLSDPTEALLGWGETALARLIGTIESQSAADAIPDEELTALAQQAAFLRDRLSLAIDLLGYRGRAEETLASIEASQVKAEQATAKTGEATFATYFARHAKSERIYAEALRWITVTLIGGVVAYAIIGDHPEAGDWVGLISRGAVVAGVTAIAAYLARQSGQHRRAAEWAKSIEIQVRTFPAFIDGVSEEDRSFVLRQLASRILASPPDKGGNSEDSVSYGQVIDLISTLAKKS